ncbi:hypothetical protein [Acinetobacter sp.]|uniref:hypothetical protein n=1 Tax=Acinetobacter sp. TaxID=472 RepID=UPI0035AFFB5D
MRSNLPQHGCDDKCDYIAGDVVVLATPVTIQGRATDTDSLLTILSIDEFCGLQVEVNGKRVYADASELRQATTAELKAKRRLPAPAALFIPHWGMDDLAGVAEHGLGEVS